MWSSGALEIFEYSVVLFQANLGHLAQFPIGDQPQSRHAAISTLQVPTKSGKGSSGYTVLRYARIASRMLSSNVGSPGAWM